MCFKSGLIRRLPAASYQPPTSPDRAASLKPGFDFQAFSAPLLLLLHGSNLDDILVIGVGGYLVIMFVLAQLKTRRLRREKLCRKAEQAAAQAQAESPTTIEEKISPNLEN